MALVFQTLYPYILRAGGLAGADVIQLNITGGTNVASSPSFDYIKQVFVPNLEKLGFPPLLVELQKRGWTTGPAEQGTVLLLIQSLPSTTKPDGSIYCPFPDFNLNKHQMGDIIKIDITILAPDDKIPWRSNTTCPKKADNVPLRKFIEEETIAELHTDTWLRHYFKEPDPIPVEVVTSEHTHHHSHVYLLVAHTTGGFRVASDLLILPKSPGLGEDNHEHVLMQDIEDVAWGCVRDLCEELFNYINEMVDWYEGEHPPCVDSRMREQLVIFEALGKLYPRDGKGKTDKEESVEDR